MDNGLIISLPGTIVKARQDKSGRRLVEVEASNEAMDGEGDIIYQKALLDSADSFIKNGHCDIDHMSELGPRLGVMNPNSYIVGRPIEVKALENGRTFVVAEIQKGVTYDPARNRFDDFWDSLQREPPVQWRASIYGFPKEGQINDCRELLCKSGATRYEISGLDWKSMAFTKSPMNRALEGYAKVVTAKAMIEAIMKGEEAMPGVDLAGPVPGTAPRHLAPRNMHDAIGQYHEHIAKDCPFSGGSMDNRAMFKSHFEGCCGMDSNMADVFAHALMYYRTLDRAKNR